MLSDGEKTKNRVPSGGEIADAVAKGKKAFDTIDTAHKASKGDEEAQKKLIKDHGTRFIKKITD